MLRVFAMKGSRRHAVQVLLRALRDFNLGKLTADDTGIFLGLLNDIFPKTLESVPRAINQNFESHVSLACFPRASYTAHPVMFCIPAPRVRAAGNVSRLSQM